MLKRVAVPAAVALLLVACSTTSPTGEKEPRMLVPQSLESTETVAVQWKRNRVAREPMKIGDWQVSEFRRGWRRTTASENGLPRIESSDRPAPAIAHSAIQFEKSKRKYSFVVSRDNAAPWECRCGESKTDTSVRIGRASSGVEVPTDIRDSLTCELSNGEKLWVLNLLGSIRPRLGRIDRFWDGQLTDGTTTIEVQPAHKLANVPFNFPVPVGYVFRGEEHDLGASQAVSPFGIRFADQASDSDRELMAVATAALLLHSETRD